MLLLQHVYYYTLFIILTVYDNFYVQQVVYTLHEFDKSK